MIEIMYDLIAVLTLSCIGWNLLDEILTAHSGTRVSHTTSCLFQLHSEHFNLVFFIICIVTLVGSKLCSNFVWFLFIFVCFEMCRCACVAGVWTHICTYIWRPKDRLLLFQRSCQGCSVSTSPESERQVWLPLTWVRGAGLEPSGLDIRALLVGPSLQSLYPLFGVLIFKVFSLLMCMCLWARVYLWAQGPVEAGRRHLFLLS